MTFTKRIGCQVFKIKVSKTGYRAALLVRKKGSRGFQPLLSFDEQIHFHDWQWHKELAEFILEAQRAS